MWNEWISQNWSELVAGKKISLPLFMTHPASAGFVPERVATDEGQCADWVLPLDDESRIHVHEFVDGRLKAHRDKIDPNRSPIHAVSHFATETELGRLATVILVVIGMARLIRNGA